MRDFDVEAVHAVVFDFEVRDAGARSLAGLELHEELAAVVVDRAELVELGIEAGSDDTAIANLRRGLRCNRARQERPPLRIDGKRLRERGDERHFHAFDRLGDRRRAAERVAQCGEIARPRGGERDAGGDALDVRGSGKRFRHCPARSSVVLPGGDGCMPRRGRSLRAQRMREPVAQETAAGCRAAGIEQREERRRRLAAQGLRYLEIAPGRRIEREIFARGLDGERAHVRERRLLRGRRVAQQRARGAGPEIAILDAECGEIARTEMLRKRLDRRGGIELPRR